MKRARRKKHVQAPLVGKRLEAQLTRRQLLQSGRKRVRRPFRKADRRPTRAEVRALFESLYGPHIVTFPGSPYQGTRFDHTELILHELAHASQIAGEIPVRRGHMGPSWERMDDLLWKKTSRALADRHEMRAVAIAIGVARSLRLPLERDRLVSSGARNCRCWDLAKDHPRFRRAVERAENTPAVWFGIQYILDLLDDAWAKRARQRSV